MHQTVTRRLTNTLERPDAALFRCAPEEQKPRPARAALRQWRQRAEYAAAGIPCCWIVELDDRGVSSIEVLALDHGVGGYRRLSVLEPGSKSLADGPIRIRLDWIGCARKPPR
ncbi:hypothetical protein [Nonomuraea diastatica]|uniref:Restriction endonuclease domain-containing protein n=1 Tax=Nonomuraea diastatica TaxID=1848329 RepID=A0A4R4VP86_9ACTN|nr:hypothetical protein [Nonomuraea diastatica]TDD07522.1 hypothetical protein E1294_48140 [Nonomuraea diastatica]